MFHHIVLMRFTPESTPTEHQNVIDKLQALPSQISAICTYDVNRDAGLAPENAHISVHASFQTQADWRSYSSHPAHLEVLDEHIKPILHSATRTQYVDETSTS